MSSIDNLNVALLPLEIKWNDRSSNICEVERIAGHLHPDTDLLILPETFSTGFPTGKEFPEVFRMSDTCRGETVSFLTKMASERNLAIAGSFIAEEDGKLVNMAFFVEPSGEANFAGKKHLFSMAGEHLIFTPGSKRLQVRYRGWNIAMVVCYDLRFPVWCRNKNNGYDILIAVANWPKVRIDAWNKLLYARAIENQSYVCGVDCAGVDDKNFEYDGSTHAIDFKGKDIGLPPTREGIIYATLSKSRLMAFRDKFPAWADADSFSLI